MSIIQKWRKSGEKNGYLLAKRVVTDKKFLSSCLNILQSSLSPKEIHLSFFDLCEANLSSEDHITMEDDVKSNSNWSVIEVENEYLSRSSWILINELYKHHQHLITGAKFHAIAVQ